MHQIETPVRDRPSGLPEPVPEFPATDSPPLVRIVRQSFSASVLKCSNIDGLESNGFWV